MKKIFRRKHILIILKEFDKINIPLDLFLKRYFQKRKSIGSKDRKFISEKIYFIIRFRGLIDYFLKSPTNEKRLHLSNSINYKALYKDSSIPPHIRVSFPKKYFNKLEKIYGREKALKICNISNEQAPTTIRANRALIKRDTLFNRWEKTYEIERCKLSKDGIVFKKRINLFATDEFKDGLFELQDEGSQLVADLMDPKPSDQVLDFCAGSGGKTLAFAHKMKGRGQIYLYDIRKGSLLNARKRLKRARIENYQLLSDSLLKNLKDHFDWILLDVPCSGSGTLRRNPDMKWKFQLSSLKRLVKVQRDIFKRAFPFLKKNGKVLFATCSIFPEENEREIEYFIDKYPLEEVKRVFWLPQSGGRDGFFASLLKKIE